MSEYATTHRRPVDTVDAEIPTTITIHPKWNPTDLVLGARYPKEFPVPTVDAIAAVQDAGYLVYEKSELPEVTQDGNGKPKLPAGWAEARTATEPRTVAQRYYEEAFGKIALAQWWEAEERRREKRVAALAADVATVPTYGCASDDEIAAHLVERGWRRG